MLRYEVRPGSRRPSFYDQELQEGLLTLQIELHG